MKKLILLIVLILLPHQSFAEDVNKFIGEWTYDGEVVLTISQKDETLKLKFMENLTWRAEFENIRIEDGVLKFEQINYMIDDSFKENHGKDHPYNGVVNYSEIWEDEEGKMLYRVWTEQLKDEPIVFEITLKE